MIFKSRMMAFLPLVVCFMPPVGAQDAPVNLREAFEFDTKDLIGYIRPIDFHNGLVVASKTAVSPITRPGMVTWNLEHYCSRGRGGRFHPRNATLQGYERAGPNSIKLSWTPTPEWDVAASAIYTISRDDRIDIEMSFEFGADYPDFEAFIASYFAPGFQPFLPLASGWKTPQIKGREQHFFARDASARRMVQDGRWDWLAEAGYPPIAQRENYQLPLIVSIFRGAHAAGDPALSPSDVASSPDGYWAWIQMTRLQDCLALSPNIFAPAHDFSLVGQAARKGDTRIVRARLLWRKIRRLDDVRPLYSEFLSSFGQTKDGQ